MPQHALPLRPAALLTLTVLAVHALLLGGMAGWSARPAVFAPPVRVSMRPPLPAALPASAPMPRATTPVARAPSVTEKPPSPAAAARRGPERVLTRNSASKLPQVVVNPDFDALKIRAAALTSTDGDEPAEATAPSEPAAPAAPPTAAARPTAATPDPGGATWPVQLPAAVRLRYTVTGQTKGTDYQAHSELLWQPAGDRYDLRLEVKLFLLGSRSETSRGALGPHGLTPERFGARSRSEQATHFDRDHGRIIFSSNAPAAPLLPGAQDRLSVILQLSGLLAANPARFRPGQTVALPVAGPRESEVWRFDVVGRENLLLQSGAQPALHLVRPPRHPYDQKIELWFAENVNYLPLRIKLTQARGDFVDQMWESSETP